MKGKLSKLEVELKGLKAQRESDENKVHLVKKAYKRTVPGSQETQ